MTKKHHVDITATSNINSISKGSVSRPMWNPADGAARQAAIEEARIAASEEHVAYLKSLEPTEQRLTALEKEVARLAAQLKLMEK
jgi:uncharacterized small protein (DUF1192 family)